MKLTLGFLLVFSVALPVRADIFTVKVDTSGIPTSTNGFLAFDFTGDLNQINTATITDFSTDGALGSGSSSGDVTGTLAPGPLVLSTSQFFNEWLQGFTYGSSFSFNLGLTTNFAGVMPDEFAFFLLDDTKAPFPTSDLLGSSLFLVDINGASPLSPTVFTSTFATVTVSPLAAVPEPSLLGLVAAVFGAALLCHVRLPRLSQGQE